MTADCLTHIDPDSLSGYIFAFEGVEDAVTILNGPTGCKYFHAAISDDQTLRQTEFDPLNYEAIWFFGQPRVPCTYLDTDDYVFGSKDKLSLALQQINNQLHPQLICVVNSPGAALIGDDLEGIACTSGCNAPVLTIDSPGFSKHLWEGYAQGCIALLNFFAPDLAAARNAQQRLAKPKVNIIGSSVYHKFHDGNRSELRRALELCNIDVHCFLADRCTTQEIKTLTSADANILLDATWGQEVCHYLERTYDMPTIACQGIPVGFAAEEKLITKVCDYLAALGYPTDPAPAIARSEKARAQAYVHLSRLNSLTGLPKGVPFALQGTPSEALGYCRFLMDYYALVPECISLLDIDETNPDYQALQEFLQQHDRLEALDKDILQTQADLVFANANVIAKLKLLNKEFSGIEIALPSMGYVNVIPKTHLGVRGGLLLTELIYNGMLY